MIKESYYYYNYSLESLTFPPVLPLLGWRRGVVVSGVRRMNEFYARQVRLVPRSVTIFGRVYHFGM